MFEVDIELAHIRGQLIKLSRPAGRRAVGADNHQRRIDHADKS